MSEQPKKAADADLKDYARQRRMDLGRPQRMPEEMRARLLREAAQLTAKSAKADDSVETPAKSPEVEVPKPAREKESSGWWLAWWPHLVLATGIAAVMILVGNQFLLSSNRIRAKNIEFAKQTVATPEKEQLDRKTLNEARALAARDENRLGPAEPSLAKQEALLAQLPPADAPAPASAPQSIPAITTTVSGRPVGLLREESDQKKKAGSLAGPAANDLAELDRSAKVGDSQTLAIQPVRAPAPAIAVTASSATSLDAAKPALQSPDRGLEQQHAESKLTAGAKNDSAQLQNGTRYHQQQVYRRNFNSP
ncbi:MAG TPA: hypothetical protein VHH73_10520, partial [Verrucomicrobiae bacterium]|nr:hypothetical protein [Verrucomicrobiae bacterium]